MLVLLSILIALLGIFLILKIHAAYSPKNSSIAFFHPFWYDHKGFSQSEVMYFSCSGGGGERVLWTAIQALIEKYKNTEYIIYSKNYNASDDEIIRDSMEKFGLDFNASSIKVIRLHSAPLFDESNYYIAKLLMQCIGSLIVGCEAIFRYKPTILIDTIGGSFAYFPFKFLSIPIIAYVHYPFTNLESINFLLYKGPKNASVYMKYIYRRFVFALYKCVGSCLTIAMVNSSWTKDHMEEIWGCPLKLVYPPCEVEMLSFSEDQKRKDVIVSLSQFRKEKNHELQIEAFDLFLHESPTYKDVKLILIGGSRNEEDYARVQKLRKLVDEKGLSKSVEFLVNASFPQIRSILKSSLIGLHTMFEEHFGISVVEFMASGLIVVANNSGGPKTDIIEHGINGFLAITAEEYCRAFVAIFKSTEVETSTIRKKAEEKALLRFSNVRFKENFCDQIGEILKVCSE